MPRLQNHLLVVAVIGRIFYCILGGLVLGLLRGHVVILTFQEPLPVAVLAGRRILLVVVVGLCVVVVG